MSSLHAVQIALEEKSGITAAAGRHSTAKDEKQEQGEAAGYVQQTGPSGGPGFRRELTRDVLDRLGQSSNAYRAKDPCGNGEGDVPVGFGPGERQNPPDDEPMGESGFEILKVVKLPTPVFYDRTTSWRCFEMEFLMAMRHLHLNSELAMTRRRSLSWKGRFHATVCTHTTAIRR